MNKWKKMSRIERWWYKIILYALLACIAGVVCIYLFLNHLNGIIYGG